MAFKIWSNRALLFLLNLVFHVCLRICCAGFVRVLQVSVSQMVSKGLSTTWTRPKEDLKIIAIKTHSGRKHMQVMHRLGLTHLAPSRQAHGCPCLSIHIWHLIGSVLAPAPGKAQICKEQPGGSRQLETHRKHDLCGLPTYWIVVRRCVLPLCHL